jgi:hypothetical protein
MNDGSDDAAQKRRNDATDSVRADDDEVGVPALRRLENLEAGVTVRNHDVDIRRTAGARDLVHPPLRFVREILGHEPLCLGLILRVRRVDGRVLAVRGVAQHVYGNQRCA